MDSFSEASFYTKSKYSQSMIVESILEPLFIKFKNFNVDKQLHTNHRIKSDSASEILQKLRIVSFFNKFNNRFCNYLMKILL